ncbi:MAG: FecR family protein [Candidatus Marinimicrobia bacterium]|jgi:ferric-dicitrate binding protein FerR (iron transport regulator)|nr:FecR family protein [Candidatus Neomarinimicrobiota bacterium]
MIRFIVTLIMYSTFLLASSKVAIAIKTKGDVSVIYKGLSSAQALQPGSPLSDQDKIKTGKNGFVAIMYLDDKTVVKMLGNSDLTILGDRSGSKINKSLDIKYGRVAANVKPQKGKEFRISTPTSVASVKGTELAIESDPSTGDSFTLIEGLVEVTNSITGESTEVQEGETATSTPEGSLEVAQTTSEDLEGFEEASIEPQTQELRFEIEDADGNLKEILIKFQ